MDYNIRQAVQSDAEHIHQLIKELCVYEKTSLSEVETTPEDLVDGFENGDFRCLVAEVDSNSSPGQLNGKDIVGFALYYHGYSTWKGKIIYLEDLYVKTEWRGKGIGTSMFKRLGQIAMERKCCRIIFNCLDWNEPAKKFYAKIGAEEQPEWRVFYFKNEAIQHFSSQ